VVRRVEHADFTDLRLTPLETREKLRALGRRNVVAFQTRNPLHRSHEELIRRAALAHDATAFIHPVVGLTKPGDIDHFSRVRGYRAVVEKYFEPGRAFLSLLPIAMRMAGPREAVWHGLIRRNYGATHLIVGRDHAGPGPGSDGRPFFGPFDAQELYRSLEAEIGVAMVPFQEMVYLADEQRYEERGAVSAGARVASISGTEVRERYLDAGRPLPEWFTRPEVAAALADAYPVGRRGVCVWFTGLSGAGKSATADALRALLLERGRAVTMLDGDEVRRHLSHGLGFSREDRDVNVLRIAFVAGEVVRHGGIAICAAISPYRAARAGARKLVDGAAARGGAFIEVFVDTPIATCEERDTKGLYARARRGELRGFTGVDDPYEAPEKPEVTFGEDGESAIQRARRLLSLLVERGVVSG
jgi:sulfate adenylyltransferase